MKRIAILVLSFALSFMLCLPVHGLYMTPETSGDCVSDVAKILSDTEIQDLTQKIGQLQSEYNYNVVIHIADEVVSNDEMSNYADDFCSYNGYCDGETDSGIALVYFDSVDRYIVKEIGADTNVYETEDLETLEKTFASDLSSHTLYEAFDRYIDNVYNHIESFPESEVFIKAEEESIFFPLEFKDPFALDVEGLNPDRGDSVVDDAELLEYWEEQVLSTKIKNIIEQYSFDVVIHTAPTANGAIVRKYVDEFYTKNGYGYGENYDGMVFALVMDSRDYCTNAYGLGIDIFNDNVINYLGDTVVDYLSDGDYYEAFSTYLDEVEQYLYEYENGIVDDEYYEMYGDGYDGGLSVDSDTFVSDVIKIEFGVLIFALLVAAFVVFVMKKQMNTAVAKHEANDYIKNGSFNISNSSDMFLYDTVTKRAKPQNNGGSSGSSRPSGGGGFSGGSRTHTSSSGRSYSSGGGKF